MSDPLINLLTQKRRMVTTKLPNPGEKVEFEGTKKEIIKWLKEKMPEIKEAQKVEITRLPERLIKEIWLARRPPEEREGILEGEVTDYACELVAQEGAKALKEVLPEGIAESVVGSYVPGVGVVHVYTKDAHEIPSFKVTQKYERGKMGPVEMEVKVEE